MQSEQHVIYRLMVGWGQGGQKLMEKDCCEWKLMTVDPQERMMPLHVNQKSNNDMMMLTCSFCLV